ncbi:hypothetical protein CS063_14860 [Sporanaerobium hydrogeniformans]|uniref:Uncharacterized protein n=1 Tax=Sporanaerobium hydrogeniformans TaxID=3072179 RepID=A0AC61D960_9FIRM|nr:DUF1788 domain-containing protein [Sporanaerobium hydrogeniformans]PHV69588.1 hypothetical protein CS063_14860 [Sporanaerobium hydrogeniformans]
MASLQERLDLAENLIKRESFRQNKGLGNEVGYYIFDYPAEHELLVREHIDYMKARNAKGNEGYELVICDLYDMIIDILEEEGFLEQCYRFEEKKGLERIIKAVGNLLQVNDDTSLIVERIKERTPKDAVVFLVGIGKCYPILRSHKVLNNLHQAIDYVPVVMFYPGKYDGQALMLFSEIKDDNYYRAFKLVE